MKLGTLAAVGIIAGAVVLAGCGRPFSASPAVRATEDAEFNVVWSAAEEVLRQYRFRIDRSDRRAGVITTFPLLGRHWFEFWRKDAVTTWDKLDGTLHTERRQATVTIARREASKDAAKPRGKYVLAVTVRTARSNRPAPHVTSTGEAYDLFFAPASVGVVPEAPGASNEVDLGRDAKLERILKDRIYSLAAKRTTIYRR